MRPICPVNMQLDFSEFYIMVHNLLFCSIPVRH